MHGHRIACAFALVWSVACAHGLDVDYDPDASVLTHGGAAGALMRDASSSVAGGSAGSSGASGRQGGPEAGAADAAGSAGAGGANQDAAHEVGASPDSGRDTGTTMTDARNETSIGCSACVLKVLYECLQDGASVQEAVFSLKVVNADVAPVALKTITIRYWYTADSTAVQEAICDGAVPDCSALGLRFGKPTAPTSRADTYLEIAFNAAATLAPSADSGEIRIRLRNANRDPYSQQNDYSFRSTGAFFVETPNITAYVDGKIAWGIEP